MTSRYSFGDMGWGETRNDHPGEYLSLSLELKINTLRNETSDIVKINQKRFWNKVIKFNDYYTIIIVWLFDFQKYEPV